MPSAEYVDKAWMSHPAVIAGDVISFVLLTASSLYLHIRISSHKGPQADHAFFFGYREEKFLASYVNFFAALAYWARVCSHANGDGDDISYVLEYKYLDYLVTCPLLTIDLMWSLNLPYKFSSATNVAICIVCAFACDSFEPPARYMWFGMGVGLFAWTWATIIRVVKQRLDQFVCKVAERMRSSLKIAVMTYFTVWCGYPIAWILKEIGVLSPIASALVHCFLDVSAKAIYGIALLEFQLGGDKHAFIFIPLQPPVDSDRADRSGAMKRSPPQQSQVFEFMDEEDEEEGANPDGAHEKKVVLRVAEPGMELESAEFASDGEDVEKDQESRRNQNGGGVGSADQHPNGADVQPETETPMEKAERMVTDWQASGDAGDAYGEEVQQMVGEIHAIKDEIQELMKMQGDDDPAAAMAAAMAAVVESTKEEIQQVQEAGAPTTGAVAAV